MWWQQHGERELRCILMTAWDPIGVGDAPEAWDEYDGYALDLARRLRDASGADQAAQDVADHLMRVERDHLGMTDESAGSAHLARLGEALVAWHEWSFTHRGRLEEPE